LSKKFLLGLIVATLNCHLTFAQIELFNTNSTMTNSRICFYNVDRIDCTLDQGILGDLTALNQGVGISISNGTGPVPTVSANTTYLQRRVTATCGPGSSIRIINADGSVVCETNTNSGGDITSVTAGSGLFGGGTSGAVTLNIGAGDGIIVGANQVRLPDCLDGHLLLKVSGTWTCSPLLQQYSCDCPGSCATGGTWIEGGSCSVHNCGGSHGDGDSVCCLPGEAKGSCY
jgi:hypothetical protein